MSVIEVTDVASDTSFKAISGQIGIDKAQGIVEAFVSGIGNKDSVGDIVVSGAFNGSLKRRKPRVVWGHDWNQPIGKVLEIYEVPKTDPRLPAKMKDAGIGGLFAKVQFNLNTERGREAFANVAFYGNDQEWSIGYKTIVADFDSVKQANMLKEVELYEISPVLHGANQLTGTISVKDDESGRSSKGWHTGDDDKDGPMNNVDAMSERIGQALSQALRKPVQILEIDGDNVVFQTGEDMTWTATVSMENGQMTVGRPTRVKPTTTYTPMGDDAPPSMMIKDPDAKGILEDEYAFATAEAAMAWSITLGCTGYHTHGGGFVPCDTHEEYLGAIAKFDERGGINRGITNDDIVDVDVDETKGATGGCSCDTEEKGHGYMRREKPEYLKDPMALLLMAYNEMLKLRGASTLRDATLSLISEVEEFLTEAPMSRPGEQGEKTESGLVVHVKCGEDATLDLGRALGNLPVIARKSESGVDIHFTDEMKEEWLMEKVAIALSELKFDVDIAVTRPIDTDAGVQ
ncbi:MAG: HK97 family phage prohead protease [Betaproteobacteria bacterium]